MSDSTARGALDDLEELRRDHAAARVAAETLRTEYQSLAAELSLLRAHYEKLERALHHTREAYESIRMDVERARQLNDQALASLAETRAQVEHVGTLGLAVARRLTAASNRYPAVAKSAKKALRGGAKVARSIAGGQRPS